MKPESLEALLIDRALGELSPETSELLAEWCHEHPAATSSATTVTDAIALARQTAPGIARGSGAVLPAPAWLSARRHWRPTEYLRLAAVLVLGAGLGWCLRPQATPRPHAVSPVPAAGVAAVPPATAPAFWSVSARVAALRANPSARPAPTVSLRHLPASTIAQPQS